jgi:hypothetical protein
VVTDIRRSVEVEYWVVDDEGRLAEPGALVDASPGAERGVRRAAARNQDHAV